MLSKDEFYKIIGQRLREAREKMGLSRAEAAEKINQRLRKLDPETRIRRLAALSVIAETLRERKRLTHAEVARRGQLPVEFVRDLEACKIRFPDAYSVYCLCCGLGVTLVQFEKKVERLARTRLDEAGRPIPAKKKAAVRSRTRRAKTE